ncbi:MAG TPA: response regulator, partial [Dehalococcoidia bacterium]|nr:response regulator [Dehalococcoidia bacterium]
MASESPMVNILLVDDEPRNLTALEAILAADDRRLVMAASGEEALRHVLREDFAVILLDVRMPGLDGFETAAFIRSRERSRHTPIIFITADDSSETHVTRGYSLGAVDYLFKPVEPEILRSKVNVFVDLFQKTEQVKRQAEQLAEATAFLENVLESSTEYAIIAVDLEARILVWNEGARRNYGYPAEDVTGRAIGPVVSPDRPDELDSVLEHLQEGRAVEPFETVQTRWDGSPIEVSVTASPIRDAAGLMIGATFIVHDISERRRAEEARAKFLQEQLARTAAEAAKQRFAFLAEASTLLSATLEYEATLDSLARVVVPHLADWCVVDLLEDDGTLSRVAAAHVDAVKSRLLEGDRRLLSREASSDSGAQRVVRSRRSEIHSDLTDAALDLMVPDQAQRAVLRELGMRSLLLVPLVARDRTLGVVTFVSAQPGRYGPDDLALAEDLARRAALAVDNARLYRDVQASVRARDEFLSSASHDLKTPLTAIRGLAQLAHRKSQRLGNADGEPLAV